MQRIRFYLILLSILLVLGVIALVWLTNTFTPDQTSIVVLVYILIMLIGFSGATLFGFYMRQLFGQREMLTSYITIASRQGFWLSLILVISLILSHQGWFTWLNAIFLVMIFVFLELFLLSRE